MKKIERPDWQDFTAVWDQRRFVSHYNFNKLDEWFDENIEPINQMLKGAVEVYCDLSATTISRFELNEKENIAITSSFVNTDHKALLIGIEPIKKESAKDMLRKIVRLHDNIKDYSDECAKANISEYILEAKAALEREK